MHNYPDNISDYTCPGCKELIPNCVCRENDLDSRYEAALTGDDEDTYYEMFDSIESDEVVKLIRQLHSNPSEQQVEKLVDKLSTMLTNHLKK